MRGFIRFIISLAVIAGVVYGGYLFVLHTINTHTYVAIDADASEDDYIILEIEPGMRATDVIDILYEEELIRNSMIAGLLVRFRGWGSVQAGEYQVYAGLSLEGMFAMFRGGDIVYGERIYIIIPEGELITRIAEIFADALEMDADDLLELWSDEDFLTELIEEYWFLTDEILDSDIIYPLEGYFYPIRHEIPEAFEDDAREVTRAMLDMTEHRLTDVRGQIEDHEMTFHEILTFAAIIEGETQDSDEKAMVAGVFQNRLEYPMLLQTDVSAQYLVPERQVQVTYDMLEYDSPYNTYIHEGLPPGPMNSPSTYAIEAAMNPAEHEYLFFISDMFNCVDGGKHYFTNYDDHLEFRNLYLNPSHENDDVSVCE